MSRNGPLALAFHTLFVVFMLAPIAIVCWVAFTPTGFLSIPAPGELSLALLDALHRRWAMLMRTMMPDDLRRTVVHPERRATLSLDFLLALYAWHGRHHTAHITELRRREDW